MKKSKRLNFGLIHYYYGTGRGKTSTLVGTIIRAHGHGLKPILIQFLKLHDEDNAHSGFFMGEINILKTIIPVKQYGSYNFIYPDKKASNEDKARAELGLKCAHEAIISGKFDLVALDEIVVAVSLDLIKLENLLIILENKPKNIEIILTGASYIKDLVDVADYVTEFTCINHPYYKGYDARPGIEY